MMRRWKGRCIHLDHRCPVPSVESLIGQRFDCELKRKGVTLFLLWEEYKSTHPNGFQYSWFCQHYRAYAGKLDLVMRQTHRAGDTMFVDYAGQTVPVVNRDTGELREAQIFVAVLGASSEDIDYRHRRGLDKRLMRQLTNGDYLNQHLNVLITGPAGVGKTWLACALAHKACRDGAHARYTRLPRLLQELPIAKADGRYSKLLREYAKPDLLILDDWGLINLNDDSRRDLEEWTRLITKMNYYGGLYIYKDGIRVLPYGNTDFDWLDMERNRTKSASYYFFSYRRIFGVVEIGSKYNFELEEKAGREGFREEFAFRQFKGILKNFFIQLAADFFRDKGEYSESFQARRLELDRLHKARQKREKFVSVRRVKFREEMDAFFEDYDAGKPHEFALELNENIGRELDVASKITDEKLAAGEFLRIERSARTRLDDLEAMYRVSKPRGIGFGRALLRDWAKYSDAYESLEKNVFGPANELVEDVVAEKARSARVELDRRLRIQNVLDELANVARRSAQGESGETSKALEKVDQEIKQASRESIEGLGSALKDVFSDFGRTDVDKLSDRQTVAARNRFELRIIAKQTEETEFLHYLRAQLEAISTDREQTKLDELEALEERTLVLEERADQDLQLTQLGMAIEVINHEFEASTKVVRDNLRRLKAWADLNSDLQELYGNIKTSFDHLDAYLSLFTPLHRRLYRKEVQFSGAEIHKFLNDLFGERLKRHSIELKVTQPFLGKRIVGFPSSFYPVFVNLLDNSIYWLRDQSEPRQIRLHTIDDAFAVSDNGPGIPERDQDDVFEFGFTRKPGGRGMGLHISREVLSRVGYEIVLVTKTQRGDSVTFLILPSKSQRGS